MNVRRLAGVVFLSFAAVVGSSRLAMAAEAVSPKVIIAEGEQFKPLDKKGWQVTHQDDSYGSHTYGGMWMTNGGCLAAPAESTGSIATQAIQVPAAGQYRVWSKYQAPPYFNYLHKIEVVQGGKTVYSHEYGKKGTDRLWSFSATSDELWWFWGVDHDTAEAPKTMATLAAGAAEVRLITVANPKPAGDRCVDFVVLTTNPADDYQGFRPYAVGSPFANEALAATKLYMRFQNTSAAPAQASISRVGHFQPQYGGETKLFPGAPVPAGQFSPWFNIGPFCRLVHDEGLAITLSGASQFSVQVARGADGSDPVGDVKMTSGEKILIPLAITWKKDLRVKTSREYAQELIAASKKWRKANGGKKPKQLLFFGAFHGTEDWIWELKDALGYNTGLPDKYEHAARDGVYAHAFGPAEIAKVATPENKQKLRILSFGDEISLGQINYTDPKNLAKFRDWLKAKKLTSADLGMAPEQAALAATGNPRLVWYSNLFNEEERFAEYRASTEFARQALGPDVLTGANYSPHHLAMCYGPVFQWVDIFKHNGMGMFWAEDYIFSVPEVPQIISWMLAEIRCGVKYNNQPIHVYVMPHAPGQLPGYIRRDTLASIGFGARHIDSFWVGPEENFTENYVSWVYPENFRAIAESFYDSAEVEKLQIDGKLRQARVAVIIGKATDFNEDRLKLPKSNDPMVSLCKNADAQLSQTLCRKDQQMLYLALRHAQHAVELITEDDIVDRNELAKYDVVYFGGEWIDSRAVQKLDAWVQKGGILYATAGIGHLNQFGEPEPAMQKLLGLSGNKLTKNAVIIRTLLELPLLPPIDTITLDGKKIPAIGMKQQLVPAGAKVLATWSDGSAAATVHEYGKGRAFAVGTLAGNTYMRSAVKAQPWPRGGRKSVYNPVDFDPAATKLVRLGIDAKPVAQDAICSDDHVEAIVMDHPNGTLLTLVNWTNGPAKDLKVSVRLPAAPKSVRSVAGQKEIKSTYADGVVTFTLDVPDADYVMLMK